MRLNDIFEPRLVGAATGSGRDTAQSAKLANCGGENKGFATFALDQARDAAGKLVGLPAGYRITVTD